MGETLVARRRGVCEVVCCVVMWLCLLLLLMMVVVPVVLLMMAVERVGVAEHGGRGDARRQSLY